MMRMRNLQRLLFCRACSADFCDRALAKNAAFSNPCFRIESVGVLELTRILQDYILISRLDSDV